MPRTRFVSIDDEGRLTYSTPEVEGYFAKRAGQWRLVPSPRGLIVLEKLETEGPHSSTSRAHQIQLSGTIISRGDMTEIVTMLHSGRWEGSLHVLSGGVHKTLMFKDGDVVGAVSTAERDRFGEQLCAHGVISRKQLEEAVLEAGHPQRLGAVLLERRLITPQDLFTFLHQQVREIFYSLLALEEGRYYFHRTKLTDPAWRQLRLPTSELLLDGMHRLDEMRYFREKIPSSNMVFERGEPQEVSLEEMDQRVFELINGRLDLLEIAREVGRSEFEVTKSAFRLLQVGLIRPRTSNILRRRRPESGQTALLDLLRLTNTALAQLQEDSAYAGRDDVLRQTPTAFHASGSPSSVLFEKVQLDSDRSLDIEQILDNLAQSKTESPIEFLYLGLNEFLDFCLFVITDGLEPAQAQQIRERLNQLVRSEGDDH